MIAQEFADLQEGRANVAIALAATDPGDIEAIELAVREAAISESANEAEEELSALWGDHVVKIDQMIAAVEQLPWIESTDDDAHGVGDEAPLPPAH